MILKSNEIDSAKKVLNHLKMQYCVTDCMARVRAGAKLMQSHSLTNAHKIITFVAVTKRNL